MRTHGRRPENGQPNRVFYAKTWLNWKKSGAGLAARRPFQRSGGDYFPVPGALKYLKKSLFGSTSITSALDLKEPR
jgi:hypothetical protein